MYSVVFYCTYISPVRSCFHNTNVKQRQTLPSTFRLDALVLLGAAMELISQHG